jgi:hypothetical protein
VNAEATQEPVANERAGDPDPASPTRPNPLPLTTLPANYPAMTPTTKMTINPWSDRRMPFL